MNTKSLNFSLFVKFLKLLFLFSFVLSLVVVFLYENEVRYAIENLKKEEESKLLLQTKEIKHDFNIIKSDVLFLTDLISSSSYDFTVDTETNQPIKNSISQYLKRKKIYDQIRILDLKGNEVLKCVYRNNKTVYIHDSLYQNKAHRYYFKEISKLKNEDIYFSRFDLNIENGVVEKPNKQVLRAGSRIDNNKNKASGIIILNYLGEGLVKRIKRLNHKYLGDFYLIDNNGYYLVSPNENDNWGFMFSETFDKKFSNNYPKSWNKISNQDIGQIENDKGIFTFKTLAFKQIINNNNADVIQFYASSDFWKIVSFVPKNKICLLKSEIQSHFYTPVIFLFILLLLLTWIYIYFKHKDRIAIKEIQKLVSVVKNSNNTIMITDLEGNTEWINHAMKKICIQPIAKIIKEHYSQQKLFKEAPSFVTYKINDAIKHQKNIKLEVSYLDIVQKKQWLSLEVKPVVIDSKERKIKIIFIGTNITDLKNKEEEILQLNNKLEDRVRARTLELTESLNRETKLNKMKSNFVSMASHELRTPLAIILSSTNLAEKYTGENEQDKRKKHFDRIKFSVKNLVDTLDYFLNIENSKNKLVTSTIDLKEELSKIINEFENLLKPKQHIILLISSRIELVTDKKIIYNIMYNLISNAIKYSHKDITVSVDEIQDQIIIEVIDKGIGIPKEQHKLIFSRFFRARNSFDAQGTGLGLNIVQNYVRMINGDISFTSEENKGTTFTLKIRKQAEQSLSQNM